MAHANHGACAVPMFHARRNPDDVAGPDVLNGAVPFLHKADASRDDQGLAERVRVPGGASARREGHGCAADPSEPAPFETVIHAHRAGEIFG